MHTSVRRIAIAALALPLLLAGCADDEPVPKVEPSTPAPSVTETVETNEPVEPTLPPEAEGKGRKAAEAFVRHYWATVDYAQGVSNTEALRSLATEECDACRAGADVIDLIYRQGGTIVGGAHTVDDSEVTGRRGIPGEGALYYANIRVSHTQQVIEGTEKLDGDYAAGSDDLRFVVIRDSKGWQVLRWYEA